RRDVDGATHAAHALEAPGRVLEVFVVEVADRPGDPDAFLDAPDAVRIEPQPRAGKRRAERTHHLDVVVGREMAALELMRREAVPVREVPGMRDHLVRRHLAAEPGLPVAVAVEEVARERYLLAQ